MRGLILFDIDGTLLRPGDHLHQQAFVFAMDEVFGVPTTLDGVPLAGMLDSQIARLALERQGISKDEIRHGLHRVMQVMEARYRELIADGERRTWVLPGVSELAEGLRDTHALAVMTGNARGVARAKLESARIGDLFAIGSYGDSAEHRHQLVPVAAEVAAQQHDRHFVGDQTLIVGDTPRDIEAARLAGTRVLAVATGRFSVDDLREHGPDLVFEDLSDVERVSREIVRVIG